MFVDHLVSELTHFYSFSSTGIPRYCDPRSKLPFSILLGSLVIAVYNAISKQPIGEQNYCMISVLLISVTTCWESKKTLTSAAPYTGSLLIAYKYFDRSVCMGAICYCSPIWILITIEYSCHTNWPNKIPSLYGNLFYWRSCLHRIGKDYCRLQYNLRRYCSPNMYSKMLPYWLWSIKSSVLNYRYYYPFLGQTQILNCQNQSFTFWSLNIQSL